MKLYKYIIFSLLFSLLVNCNRKVEKQILITKINTLTKYAKGFDIQKLDKYIKLTIKTPYPNSNKQFEYILVRENFDISALPKSSIIIQIPIKKTVVTSTTHIPMLELLGVESSLVGFPNTKYISSEKTRKLIENGTIRELGMDSSLNTEIVIDLNPDVIIGFAMNAGNKSFETVERAGIPVIINGDWLEETPLGRAEWLKFFGALYDMERKADSIFKTIEDEYKSAKEIVLKATTKPTILSGAMFKDVWNLPAGESFVSQFLNDANTDYLWKETKGKGSLQLNFESVLDKAQNADIWIAPGYFETKSQMIGSSPYYTEFKAFNTNNIYTFATIKGKTGGVIYFELAPSRPDLVLKDIIKIAHPSLMQDYKFTFFERMK